MVLVVMGLRVVVKAGVVVEVVVGWKVCWRCKRLCGGRGSRGDGREDELLEV